MNDLREWVDSLGWDSNTWFVWSLMYLLVGSIINWRLFEAYYREERPFKFFDGVIIILMWPLVTFTYLYILIKDRKVSNRPHSPRDVTGLSRSDRSAHRRD